MKKVLVTGAAGVIGIQVIKYLLSEGKYEITALDLRTKQSQKKLKRYRRRINLVYGDICDSVLIDALVKNHDYVIHLAGVLPPLADIKKNIGKLVDYEGTKNIVNAISSYNPKCFLVYASSTTVYGNIDNASTKTPFNSTKLDYFSNTKIEVEKLIGENLKNYTIIRLPLVLCNPKSKAFMYQVKRNNLVETITDNDAGYLFASSILETSKINKKIYNVSGGEEMTTKYGNILIRVLETYGFSWHYFLTLLFMDKNYYSPTLSDSEKLEELINFRSDSLPSFYMRLKRQTKKRFFARILAKPFIFFLKRKVK